MFRRNRGEVIIIASIRRKFKHDRLENFPSVGYPIKGRRKTNPGMETAVIPIKLLSYFSTVILHYPTSISQIHEIHSISIFNDDESNLPLTK